jgi:hypothetical protein
MFYISDDSILHSYRRENLKSYKIEIVWSLETSESSHQATWCYFPGGTTNRTHVWSPQSANYEGVFQYKQFSEH